tara:strand:+ start:51 stop:647 length:597 start_codon:yes stop_codon:yes gene_type:complete
MLDDVLVFDDIININYQLQIKELLMGEGLYMDEPFPWYFISDMTYNDGGENQGRCGFTHYFANEDDGIISDFHSLFIKLIQNSCKKIKIKKVDVLQARSFFQLPTNIPKEQVDDAHIDLIDTDHFVMLYYVSDSDGDTIIYNERKKSESYTIKKKVTPKQGRVVLFDGRLYHTAEQPNKDRRCIVNYDLVDLSVDSHI